MSETKRIRKVRQSGDAQSEQEQPLLNKFNDRARNLPSCARFARTDSDGCLDLSDLPPDTEVLVIASNEHKNEVMVQPPVKVANGLVRSVIAVAFKEPAPTGFVKAKAPSVPE